MNNDKMYEIVSERAKAELPNLMKVTEGWVEECLAKGENNWMPKVQVMMLGGDPNDYEAVKPELVLFVVADNFNEYEEKKAVMGRIGRQIYENRMIPLAVCFTSEAWISKQSEKEFRVGHMQPRHDPQRKEAIIVTGETIAARKRHGEPGHSFASHLIVERENSEPRGKMRADVTENKGQWLRDFDRVESNIIGWFWEGYFEELRQELTERN